MTLGVKVLCEALAAAASCRGLEGCRRVVEQLLEGCALRLTSTQPLSWIYFQHFTLINSVQSIK